MPWKATRQVDERIRFIAAVKEDPRGNFSRLCESFGISRAKGYKWVTRYEALGPEGLRDQAPIARSCPHRTSGEMETKLVELRKKHPFDGPKKLRARLLDQGVPDVPAASTVGEIIERYGLVRPRRRRLRTPPSSEPLALAQEPNDLWCTDFKGHFACGSVRCYPLTITDGWSRFLIKCEGLREPKGDPVQAQFELSFREFGLPARIRSDNGAPFASTTIGGLSRLSIWWIQLGIVPERIAPGEPQQNGSHERFHRTLKEQTANPPKQNFPAQQLSFDSFRGDFNNHRPHEALGMKTPASFYEPSFRAMPSALREPEYRSELIVRRVNHTGDISFRGHTMHITKLLGGQPIALRPLEEDKYEIFYGPLHVGFALIRAGTARIEPLR